jgi:hypothetical protein
MVASPRSDASEDKDRRGDVVRIAMSPEQEGPTKKSRVGIKSFEGF